ncbi:hypothetical protein EVA_20762, partial [gut metagenome]
MILGRVFIGHSDTTLLYHETDNKYIIFMYLT